MFSSNSSSDHDNWYAPAINESLAFYMSTNTFNNPIFEAQFELNSSQEEEIVSGGGSGSSCTEQNEVGRNQEELSRSSESSSQSTTFKVSNGNNTIKQQQQQQQQQQQNNWTNFCDNLMFSIKSKIYVFELNFKRKLQRLKRFASGHLPSWLMTNIGSVNNHATAATKTTNSGENIYEYENYNDDYEMGEDENEEDKFWETIQQPYSKDSLNVQQEKILSRLEQVIQAKRSNSFHGFLEQQQQQQEGEKLFNMAQSESNARLRLNRSADGLRGCSSKQANNNGNGGTKFKAGFNRVLNTAGISSPKLKDNQGPRRTRVPPSMIKYEQVRSRWLAGTQSNRQVHDFSVPQTDFDDDQTKTSCIVCYTNQPNILTLPCKHHNTCSDCFIEIIYSAVKNSRYPLKCVLCRQKIERIRCSRLFLLKVIKKNYKWT